MKNIRFQPKKILQLALVVCVLLCCAFVICACDKKGQDEVEIDIFDRDLYYVDLRFDAEQGIALAIVSFSGDSDKKIEGTTSRWTSTYFKVDAWYNGSQSVVKVDPQAIFCAVQTLIPQEDMTFEDVEYNTLKVYIKYDTIYKSIKSDGQVYGQVRNYSHYFELDETQNEYQFTLTRHAPNSANWYSILIVCALAVAIVCVAIHCAKRLKIWQKKKKE